MTIPTANLWVSNAGGANGADRYHRDPSYVAHPAKWVSQCFSMAKALGMNLIVSIPNGLEKPGPYQAGVFREPEANLQFSIERGRWKAGGVELACGLYIGKYLPDGSILDPATKASQDFMAGPLLPFVAPGNILGVDAIAMNHDAAQRLYDACACFGVKFYQEGIPYDGLGGDVPALGTMQQHLVMDPGFNLKVPAGMDYRLRVGLSDLPLPKLEAAIAACKGNGWGIDVLSWPGDPTIGTIAALVAGPVIGVPTA